jgi:hypothetical protein
LEEPEYDREPVVTYDDSTGVQASEQTEYYGMGMQTGDYMGDLLGFEDA